MIEALLLLLMIEALRGTSVLGACSWDVGGWERTEIDIDGDDRAFWIENCSPCPESPVQMARTRVASLARDLQHTQCTSASASWSLLFS